MELRAKEIASRVCSKRCQAWDHHEENLMGVTKCVCELGFAEINKSGMAYPGKECPCYSDMYTQKVEETYYQDDPEEDEVEETEEESPVQARCKHCDYFQNVCPTSEKSRCHYSQIYANDCDVACGHFIKIGSRMK